MKLENKFVHLFLQHVVSTNWISSRTLSMHLDRHKMFNCNLSEWDVI